MKTYRELKVWQKAIDLVVACYELTKEFPDDERYGLTSQLRRAAVSVPANVAEGQSCGKDGRFLSHIGIAQGSVGELDTDLEIALRLGFIQSDEYAEAAKLVQRTGQLLHGLARSVRRRRATRLTTKLSLAALLLMPGLLFILR